MNRLLTILLFWPAACFAQNKTSEVLAAERSFAAYSVAHGTKAAFLAFADSGGLVFENGRALNAISTWNSREARPGVLRWFPIFAVAAGSGDFGFTSGPWTFQPNSVSDSIVARGQYNTVWHKKNGEWKFLLDLGLQQTPPFDSIGFHFGVPPTVTTPGTVNSLFRAEKAFIHQTTKAKQRLTAYKNAVSADAFLLGRNGQRPVAALNGLRLLLANMPATIEYTITGWSLAKSGDLGYFYGDTTINGKKSNYLRIWWRQGRVWKLILEVLPY